MAPDAWYPDVHELGKTAGKQRPGLKIYKQTFYISIEVRKEAQLVRWDELADWC